MKARSRHHLSSSIANVNVMKEKGCLIAAGIVVSEIPFRLSTLPALIYASKIDDRKLSPKDSSQMLRIASFVAQNCESNDVDAYWIEALRVRDVPITSISVDIESSRPAEKVNIIYQELLRCGDIFDQVELTTGSILDERTYQSTLNLIIPVVVGSLTLEELDIAVRALMASSLAGEHISNIALNFPHICAALTESILAGAKRDTVDRDPAYRWRSYRVLLMLASQSRNHAISVRKTIAAKKLHPKLCLEISSRFINDMEMFIHDQLWKERRLSEFWLLESTHRNDSSNSLTISVQGSVPSVGSNIATTSNSTSEGSGSAAIALHLQHLQVTKICSAVSQKLQETTRKLLTDSSKNRSHCTHSNEVREDLANAIVHCAGVLTACSWTSPDIPEIEAAANDMMSSVEEALRLASGSVSDVISASVEVEEALIRKLQHAEGILRLVVAMLLCRITSLVSSAVSAFITATSAAHGTSSSYATGSGIGGNNTQSRAPAGTVTGSHKNAASALFAVLQAWATSARTLGAAETVLKNEEFVTKAKSVVVLLERAFSLQDQLIGIGGNMNRKNSTGDSDSHIHISMDDVAASSYLTAFTGEIPPWDSARCHRLFLRLITTYDTADCRTALGEFCVAELKLGHLADFMPVTTSPVNSTATTNASSSSSSSSASGSGFRDMREGTGSRDGGPMVGTVGSWVLGATIKIMERCRLLAVTGTGADHSVAVLSREFRQLRRPKIISAANEKPGDWLCCLSLMFSCNIMRSNMLIDPDEFEEEDNLVLGKSASAFVATSPRDDAPSDSTSRAENVSGMEIGDESDMKTDKCVLKSESAPGSTHDLMYEVLQGASCPPHSCLQRCIDGWLFRCSQSSNRYGANSVVQSSSVHSRTSMMVFDGTVEIGLSSPPVSVGLPLLPNEAASLSSSLQEYGTEAFFSDTSLCKNCLQKSLRYIVPQFSVSHKYRRSKFPPLGSSSAPAGVTLPALKAEDVFGDAIHDFMSSLGHTVQQNDNSAMTRNRCTCSSPTSPETKKDCSASGSPALAACWPGVMACYSALHFAALSAEEGLIFNGPFVCDLRALPIKRALQFLLRVCGDIQAGTILATMVELVEMQCPELILPERLSCYNLANDSKLDSKDVGAMTQGAGAAITTKVESPIVLEWILSCEDLNLKSVRSIREHLPSLNSSTMMSFLQGILLPKAVDLNSLPGASKVDAPVFAYSDALLSNSSVLWEIWKNLHDFYPTPQQLELATINSVLTSIANSKSHALWYASRPRPLTSVSFLRLMQEPLVLFRLPLELLRHPFICRLVCFTTRSALAASRSAVHEALRAKQRVANSFLSASLKDRSVAEACIDIDEELYFDLQELMATRIILQLWEELTREEEGAGTDKAGRIDSENKDPSKQSYTSASMRCDQHAILTDLLRMLLSENGHLCGLILESGIDAAAFELLLTADETIADNLGRCLLTVIMSTSEATPELLENLLRHSLYYLRCRSFDELSRRMALALPAFMIRATSSINPYLAPKETKGAEAYCALVVKEIMKLYPDCALKLLEFAHSSSSSTAYALANANTNNPVGKQGSTAAIMANAMAMAAAAHEDDKPFVKSLRAAIKAAFSEYMEGQYSGAAHTVVPNEGAYLASFIARQGRIIGAPAIHQAPSYPTTMRAVVGKSPLTVTVETEESGSGNLADLSGNFDGSTDAQTEEGLLSSSDITFSATGSFDADSGERDDSKLGSGTHGDRPLKRPRSQSASSDGEEDGDSVPQKLPKS